MTRHSERSEQKQGKHHDKRHKQHQRKARTPAHDLGAPHGLPGPCLRLFLRAWRPEYLCLCGSCRHQVLGHQRRHRRADHLGEFRRHVSGRGVRRGGSRPCRAQARIDLLATALCRILADQRPGVGRLIACCRALCHRHRSFQHDGDRQHLHHRILPGGPARPLHGAGDDHRLARHSRHRLGVTLRRAAGALGLAADLRLGRPWHIGVGVRLAHPGIAALAAQPPSHRRSPCRA